MPGFLAIPNEWRRACRGAVERGAYLWIADQAEAVDWGDFPLSTTDLIEEAADGLCSRRWAATFLDRLEATGALVIVDRGTRKRTRIVRVPSPLKARQNSVQVAGQVAGHRKAPPTGTTGARETEPETEPETGCVLSIETEEEQKTPETEDKPPSSVQLLWEHNRQWHPRRKAKPGLSDAGYLRGRIQEDGLNTCKLVADYCHYPSSWWGQRGATGIATIYKATGWSDRVEQAEKWDAAGRTRQAKPNRKGWVNPFDDDTSPDAIDVEWSTT